MHSITKHIEIRHHFLREHIANGNCEIKFTGTELQLADLFTRHNLFLIAIYSKLQFIICCFNWLFFCFKITCVTRKEKQIL